MSFIYAAASTLHQCSPRPIGAHVFLIDSYNGHYFALPSLKVYKQLSPGTMWLERSLPLIVNLQLKDLDNAAFEIVTIRKTIRQCYSRPA